MTNYIEINPSESNGILNSLNKPSIQPTMNQNQNPTMQPNLNMNNLQSMLQLQLVSKVMGNLSFLQSGDPTIDMITTTMIQTLIITLVSVIVSKIGYVFSLSNTIGQSIINTSFSISKYGLVKSYQFIKNRIYKPVDARKKIHRTVDIPYISDTRQINELYKAVFWYLTNDSDIDYLHEPYLQYVFDKKVTIENRDKIIKDLSIHKILTKEKTKTIQYKNHEIKYSLSTELITVYTDKDRKRENYKVQLSTYVDEIEKNDVLEDFSQHCLTEYINNLTSSIWEQRLYNNVNGEWKATPSNNTRKLDTIILKNSLKDDIKTDLQLFLNSEEWYKERDIPYTRGYMFYGHPGTGKTSMIKGISLYAKRHIHSLVLSDVSSDTELMNLLKSINYKETVLVIEDIDATLSVVKSRDDKSKSDKKIKDNKDEESDSESNNKPKQNENNSKSSLTLSGLLNAIDGVFTCNGRILIMTTNHPEVLDSALIRPGRIDSKYLFDNCDKKQIKELYEMFFSNECDMEQLNNIKNNNYSPAHITSVFLRYRNQPGEALKHLDDIETKILIPKLENQLNIKYHDEEKNKQKEKVDLFTNAFGLIKA